ncbi:MAG: hypothetical protein HF308_18570 [Ignavibacteria bacterium]|jgi:hypothetical protein|nr:hypothetical protein [Ignavibacteria bacterium]
MAETPDGTLVKIHNGFTSSRLSAPQFALVVATIIIDYVLFKLATTSYAINSNPRTNYIFDVYVIIGVIITGIVYLMVRSDLAFYRSWNFLVFLTRWLRQTDHIYKHDEKHTSDNKLDAHIMVKRMIEKTGVLKFNKCKTYKDNVCDTGILWVVNPQTVRDQDEFYEITSILLYSIQPGLIQKYHAMQSQDVRDIAAQYEERLKLPQDKLSAAERVGLFSTKQFLRSLSGRVNWAYFIFLGTGYYTNDEESVIETERKRKAYEHFLQLSEIEYRLITSKWEYKVAYKQMSSMKQLGVVTI